MTQQTIKTNECTKQMSDLKEEVNAEVTTLQNTLQKMFWYAICIITGLMCSGFAFYYNIQENKINRIAVSSIKADERLEKRIDQSDNRQIQMEKAQATMAAKLDSNMKWLMEACNRIESKQLTIESRLDNQ